jgi:hypothetical protein
MQFHYWYTRSTTVGISIIGSSLTAVSFFLFFVIDLWRQRAFRQGEPFLSSLYVLVVGVYWYILTPALIVRAMWSLKGTDSFPHVKLNPASHLERASARSETKGKKGWIIGVRIHLAVLLPCTRYRPRPLQILITVFTFHFVEAFRDLPLIARVGPNPDPTPGELITANAMENYLVNSLFLSGTMFQVSFNYRSKMFAGQHKLAAWMALVSCLIGLGPYISWLAWRAGGSRNPLLLVDAVRLGLTIAFAVQGMLYNRVEQDIEDQNTS